MRPAKKVTLDVLQNKRIQGPFVQVSDPSFFFSIAQTTKPKFDFVVCRFGGDKRDRTADLLNAIQALSRIIRYTTPDLRESA